MERDEKPGKEGSVKTTDAIRQMCESSEMGTIEVSEQMGKSRGYLSATLSRGNVPRADTLAQIAQACGYELVLEGRGERIVIEP